MEKAGPAAQFSTREEQLAADVDRFKEWATSDPYAVDALALGGKIGALSGGGGWWSPCVWVEDADTIVSWIFGFKRREVVDILHLVEECDNETLARAAKEAVA